MIVHDAIAGKKAITITINFDYLGGKSLGTSIRRCGEIGRILILRERFRLTKYLTRRRMEQSRLTWHVSHNLEKSQGSNRRKVAGHFRHRKTQTDVTLSRQVIKLVRLYAKENTAQGGNIFQIGIVEEKTFIINIGILKKVRESGTLKAARPANNAVNFVIICQQIIGQIRAILPRNAGYKGEFHNLTILRKTNLLLGEPFGLGLAVQSHQGANHDQTGEYFHWMPLMNYWIGCL